MQMEDHRDHEDVVRKRGSDKKRTRIRRDKRRRKKLGTGEDVPSRQKADQHGKS
jgi:hypothetical protein